MGILRSFKSTFFHAYFLFQKESKYLFFNISKTKKYTKTPKKIPNTVKIKFF